MSVENSDPVAYVLTDLAKKALRRIWGVALSELKLQIDVHFKIYEDNTNKTYQKNSKVKTLYSGGDPLWLNDIYTESRFTLNDEIFRERDIIENLNQGGKIVITGHGGAGKTIFLKHLYLHRIQDAKKRIPFFLELRRFNKMTVIDLKTHCRSELGLEGSDGEKIFIELCKKGKLEFIFDGFDEINQGVSRDTIESEILEFSHEFPDCSIILTGRNDERYEGWHQFKTYQITPLSFEEAKNLVHKIKYKDSGKLKDFKEKLTKSFYKQHKSFMSNPLQIAMMFLTFTEHANIPDRLVSFYDRSFSVLWSRHDASKESFERQRCCDEQEFKDFLCVFCFMSYKDECYEFEDCQLKEYTEKAKKFCKFEKLDTSDLIRDLCETVNILQQDGFKYSFIHRSFQEFFAAKFTVSSRIPPKKLPDVLSAFAKRSLDSTFKLCCDLDIHCVYEHYFDERIKRYKTEGYFLPLDADKCIAVASSFKSRKESFLGELFPKGIFVKTSSFSVFSWQTEFFEFCSALSQLNLVDLKIPRELFVVYDFAIFGSFMRSLMAIKRPFKPTEQLRLEATRDASKKIKISLRNIGDDKVPTNVLMEIRKKCLSEVKQEFKEIDTKIVEDMGLVEETIEKLIEKNKHRQQSATHILGL